jgi:hypothetical protein
MKNMKIRDRLFTCLAACLMMIPAAGALAEQAGLQLGILQCEVVPGSRVNLLIRSTADVTCTYDNQGTIERYRGETGIGLGLDLSFKSDEKMAFAVIAASADATPGAYALAGRYVGGQAAAAAGVGVGAKVLVGAGNKNLSLQPLALETATGLGASAGLGFLYIERAD